MKKLIESLESRLLFVTINGTNAANAISVSIDGNDILYAVDGQSERVLDALHFQIEINGLGGNDTITIVETGANTVTVNGGAGADTINLALGANDMDAIDDVVTVNGDADLDTITINDQNNVGHIDYFVSGGAGIQRENVPTITANVEDVHIHTPTSSSAYLHVNGVPTPDVRFEGTTTQLNSIFFNGNGTQNLNYRPDDITHGEGDITYNSSTIDFESCDLVSVDNVLSVTFTTPNVTDVLSVSKGLQFVIDGTSTGTEMAELRVTDTPTVTIDMAASEGATGNDSLLATGSDDFIGTLRINAGAGNNTLNVFSGSWTMTTALGLGGVNLDTTISNANVAFSGAQSLRRLELNNNGVASFSGGGVSVAIQDLAVETGTGTINVTSPTVATVVNTLSIVAGGTLNKGGTGTLNVNATQTNGANSLFENNGGTTNFSTDCGSTSSRPLDLFADFGNINLNATQHVDSLSTNFGDINVGANGNRVVVTNSVSIGGEGGSINLNDNDMILDYTGASQLENVRQLLLNGHAGGDWDGLGIGSGTAGANPQHNTGLGYAEATDLFTTFPATFAGQSIDNTCVLIKYTYYGDSDLDGDVDLADFNRLAGNFGTSNKRWIHGDSTYETNVTLADFNRLASAFGLSGLSQPSARTSPFASGRLIDDVIGSSGQETVQVIGGR